MKTNLSFLIMLFIAIIAFVNDIIIYVFKLDYLLSLIISFVIGLCLFVFLHKKKKIKIENYFCKWDLIFLGAFLVFTIIKITIPDYYYDTANYHYYNQKYPFIDKINFDFLVAGGRVSDWVYPLADRMNYIFRFLLGIRLGTILNYFSIVVIFYEVKKLLKFLVPDIKPSVQIFCSAFPVSIPILFRFIGTYYIDIYSTAFLLELFYIGVKEKELLKKRGMLYFWFLLAGITIGIKISNLVLLIPIGINIIYNNIKLFKEIKIKDYIISIVLFILPFVIYGINNLVQMGNFFYPFFGGEKYYPVNDWQESRFGISNFWYSFIWPIVVTVLPGKGHDESYMIELIWAFGYVFLIINLLIKIFSKELKTDLFRIEVLSFVFCILWSNCMNGYCRYAIVIPILFSVSMTTNFCISYKDNKIANKIFYGLQYLSLIVIFTVTVLGTIDEMSFNIRNLKNEVKNIFVDKSYTIYIDGVWGTINDNSGMTSLVREEGTPIYNLDNYHIQKSDILYTKYKETLRDKDIYVITSKLYRPADDSLKLLEEKNFEVIEKVAEYDYTEIPYLHYLDKWEIYKVRYVGKI